MVVRNYHSRGEFLLSVEILFDTALNLCNQGLKPSAFTLALSHLYVCFSGG